MIKIRSIVRTCCGCPAQWDAVTTDDIPVYIRYRWSRLSVRLGDKDGPMKSAVMGEEIFSKEMDSTGLSGVMSFDELCEITKDIIEFPKENIIANENDAKLFDRSSEFKEEMKALNNLLSKK